MNFDNSQGNYQRNTNVNNNKHQMQKPVLNYVPLPPGLETQPTAMSSSTMFWVFLLVFLIYVLLLCVFQQSWNYAVPQIFGLHKITLLQGLTLIIVARLLLGRF